MVSIEVLCFILYGPLHRFLGALAPPLSLQWDFFYGLLSVLLTLHVLESQKLTIQQKSSIWIVPVF